MKLLKSPKILASFTAFFVVAAAHGATVTWVGGGGSDYWSNSANWDVNSVPGSGDDVVFNSGSANATLNLPATVQSITFTSGYTGTFSFSNYTLTINAGDADFRSGGAISAGSGALIFTASSNQTFIPKSGAVFPSITQNGNTGTTTVSTHALTAGSLTVTLGTFHLGTGLTHTVGALSGGGILDFGTSNLNATGNVNLNGMSVTASASNTLAFTGASPQAFTPNASLTALKLTQNGAGGTTVINYNFTTPQLAVLSGNFDLGSSLQHIATELSATGGGLAFGSSQLDVSGSLVDLGSLDSIGPGTGYLRFTGSGTQTFIPKAGAPHPSIWQYGSGTTTITSNNLTAGSLTPTGGTFRFGSGLTHHFAGCSPGGGPYGSLDFGSSQVHFSGSVDLSALPAITPGTGSIHFDASTGIQYFTPKSGTTLPSIHHPGAGTLQLYNYNLTCASFTQTAGVLDLNGRNITTTGDFTVANGTPGTFAGLAGRTLTIGGNLNLSGTSVGSRLNLNPASNWNLSLSGQANASFANVAFSTVSGGPATCARCVNGSSNTNWIFPIAWDGGGGSAAWSLAANWEGDVTPASGDDVLFDATSQDAALDANVNIRSIVFTPGYTGNFSFGSFGMTVNTGKADFRSGGTVSGGTGTLAFTGNANQVLTPKAGAAMPSLHLNGTGGVTLNANAFTGGNLTLQSGLLDLGSGFTHSVVDIIPGSGGGIVFNNSTLQASGASVSFANLGTLNYGTGTLVFNGASPQTFIGKSGVFHPKITQNGSGGTTVSTYNWTTGTLTIASGVFNLGTGRSLVAGSFSATGGGIDFGSSNLEIDGASVDFSALNSVTPGSGTLTLWNGTAHTFIPKASTPHPSLTKNGAGTLILATNALQTGNLVLNEGTLNLGSGFTHSAVSIAATAGALAFNNSTLQITAGNADLGLLASLSEGTGILRFTGPSGTQVFTPKASVTHPSIQHTGAGELQLAGNDLACLAFTQTAGILNLGGRNLTTGGDFSLSNGNASSATGLAGRTLTVGGNASLHGATSTSRLSLNAASGWTLAVTGSLSASLATLQNSTASVSGGICTNCANLGGNTGWTVNVVWDGGGGNANWTTPANWASDYVPTSDDLAYFNSTSANALLDADAAVRSINMSAGYTGTFDFSNRTLTVNAGTADFRSGGALTPGTGTLAFTSGTTQTLYPKSGGTMPSILLNGAGGVNVAGNALIAGNLTIQSGILNLGTGFTHAVTNLTTSGGGMVFGNSILQASGATIDLSGLASMNQGTGTLAFTGASPQTFTGLNGVNSGIVPNLTQNGAGGTTSTTYNWTTPNLSIQSGVFHLGAGLLHTALEFSATGGGFDFGSTTLQIQGATVDFSPLSSLTAGTGTVFLYRNAAQAFTPKASTLHPNLTKDGSGTLTLQTNALQTGNLGINTGTVDLGSGFTHSAASVSANTGTSLNFNDCTLRITEGNAMLHLAASLNAGSGTLEFTAPTGTQYLYPRASTTHPHIVHSGSGTLRLSDNPLVCLSFNQTVGVLHLNALALTASGDLTLSNGNSGSLLGLATQTLTVGGDASLAGASSASRLNLNPETGWTLAVTGSLNASLASLQNCNASVTAGVCTNCSDGGGNTNWSNAVTWDGGGNTSDWSTAENWGSDALPASTDDVIFNAGSDDASLTSGVTIKSLTFTSGYSGDFNLDAYTLTLQGGNGDFRSGGTFSYTGSGQVQFTGSGARTLRPMASGSFPWVVFSAGGSVTVASNALTATSGIIVNGSVNLGSGFTHTVGGISGTGSLDFGTSNVNATGDVDLGSLTLTATAANNLAFTGSSAQLFVPNTSEPDLSLSQAGSGGTTVTTNGFTTPALGISNGTLNLGSGLSHTAGTFSALGGSLNFSGSVLALTGANVDFSGLSSIAYGSGQIYLNRASAMTLVPHPTASLPRIDQYGSGTTTVSTYGLKVDGFLALAAGTFNLGTGLTHTIQSLGGTGAATLDFGSSTLRVTGNFGAALMSAITPGTGTLEMVLASGTQTLTPKTGYPLPAVIHSGAGTLQINNTTLACASFSQTAGTLDLNSQDITTSGAFTITNGSTTSLSNLGGRTLTVGGAASFTGQSGSLLNLNPASAWTLAATGGLSAQSAHIMNCNATGSAGNATASVDGGNNTAWNFTITWDGGGADENWSTGGNWSSDAAPSASTSVVFDGTSVKNVTLDAAATVKNLTVGSAYAGTFAFSTQTLSVTGAADLRTGGTFSAGNGSLAFTGATAQVLQPPASGTLPNLVQNGSGGTSIATNPLNAGTLTLSNGAFNLGNGFIHAVTSIGGTGGSLAFGSSMLRASGNVDLSGLATMTAGTGKLEFNGTGGNTFMPLASVPHPRLAQNGTGTTTLAGDVTTPSLRVQSGTLSLGNGRTLTATDTLAATAGTLQFGSSTLKTAAATVDLSGLSVLDAVTGTLEFIGASPQTLLPKAGSTHPTLVQSGSGGTLVYGSALTADFLNLTGGTFDFGDQGLTHTLHGIAASGGALDFGTSTVQATGVVDFGSLGTLIAGTGTLSFTASSGTQVFTPKNGAVHPLLTHPSSGTVQLSGSDLACRGFAQNEGTWNLAGFNLSVVSAGNLSVTGSTTPFAGLGGRTLSISGNAHFAGAWGTPLNLDPASPWTLSVTGALTANNVRLRNSAASNPGTADSSFDLGNNSGWTFIDSIRPANVTGFLASAHGGHGAALSWTASAAADADTVILRYRTDGAYPSTPTDGTLWRKVAAAITQDTASGLTDKAAYWFAAFVKDSAGNFSPAAAAARDSARLPDVTPPLNVSGFTATAFASGSAALAWTASASADADSVQIRYRTGLAAPGDTSQGTLWRKVRTGITQDTVTGLSPNTVYAFGLFVRDSSGNYGAAQAGAQDTALFQNPVSGSVAVQDLSGFTRDADPPLVLAASGADSMRIALLADTAAAAWRALSSLDSIALAGADGQKIIAAQFKNAFGKRSAWARDTTVLDRLGPATALDLEASLGRWTWPASVSGKSLDAASGVDRVLVMRRRIADGFFFNGTSWAAVPDTARLSLSAGDSLFAASLPVSALSTGDYQVKAWALDRAGNAGAPAIRDVHYEDNRAPETAFADLKDSVLQNQAVSFRIDFGDRDTADTLTGVSAELPAWLQAVPGPDTAAAPWALHKVYSLAGKPGQGDVGAQLVRIRVQDRGGLLQTYTRTVVVVDVNDPPAFSDSQGAHAVPEDGVSRWTPDYADPDPADKPSLSLLSGPAFATLSGGELTFRPGSRDVGDHLLRLSVSDGSLSDTLETVITVTDVNDPPFAFHGTGWSSPFFFKEDRADTFTVVVVDLDRNEPVVLATQLPPFIKASSTTDSTGINRTFRFVATPGQDDTGSVSLALRFQDARQAMAQLALNARVLADNDMPTALILESASHAGAARFRLGVSDEDGSLEKARFHYRLVDAATGDTVRRGITPNALLALHPLADGAYLLAVKAEDQDGLRQDGFTVSPFAVSGATTLALDTARWHMIGPQQATLPASAFGAGAVIASWDEAGDDGQPMARYASGKAVEKLKRGKGYWVRLASPVTLRTAQKDLPEGAFAMRLTRAKQGWNQVANPYPYWIDVSASKLTYWEWNADTRDLVNARGLLKPWAAYWVSAAKDTVLALPDAPWFPASQPAVAGGPLAKSAGAQVGQGLGQGGSLAYEGDLVPASRSATADAFAASFRHRGDWAVRLGLRAGAYEDACNAFGIREGRIAPDAATDGLADPPKFGDYLALRFDGAGSGPSTRGGTADGGLAADFHPALDPEEEWWDFAVEDAGTGETMARLRPEGLEPLAAQGLKVFLVKRGEASPMEPGGSVALALEGGKTWYSLVVTPHADFASRLKGNFSISQNFPNPVTTFTAFRFILPQSWDKDGKRMAKDFKLRIKVYDYNGREAAVAASGTFRAGSHTLTWRPVSASGSPLARGAYVYRLETAGFAKSLKMVLE